ncbi:MAG TPA: ABC transporter substrate-binding protein [Polyangiaceae bacterium]|nr:ABC transporter substrate-binding protein [Polyangiaceae bacterium]
MLIPAARSSAPWGLAIQWIVPAVALLACDGPRADRAAAVEPPPSRHAESFDSGDASRPVEFLSWWGPVGESNPTEALLAFHKSRYPQDLIVNAKTIFAGQARKTAKAQLESGDPPDVFQSTIGKDHMQWVLTNGIDGRGAKILAVDDFIEDAAEWRKVIPAGLLAEMSFDGKLYGVPATVHRINAVFYNRRVLRSHGLAVPSSVAELENAGETLRAAGIPLFAIGAREPWPLGHFVFEGLLVALEGPAFYKSYFSGRERADDPRIVEALRVALRLLRYARADSARLTWLQAGEKVAKGEAAATVTGDWAEVFFAPNGLGPDDAVVEGAFPGSENTLVFTVDVFSVPVASKNLSGAKRLLSTIGSQQGQRLLSRVKGCLSPRSDVDAELVGPMRRRKFELLRDGRTVMGLVGLIPPRFYEDVNWALLDMMEQDDVEPVVQTLRARYRLLSAPADLEVRPF